MSDTARQAWRQWWDEEGSAMRPLPNEDTEQFARRMTEIAWSNGAFKRLADVEYLCLKQVGLEAQLAAAKAELAAAIKQRDEARENLRDACEEIATLVNSLSMLSTNKTAEYIAAERGWDCFPRCGRGVARE